MVLVGAQAVKGGVAQGDPGTYKEPEPPASRTLTAYSFVFLATPYVFEPMVPAT